MFWVNIHVSSNTVSAVEQRSPNYGPWATSGPPCLFWKYSRGGVSLGSPSLLWPSKICKIYDVALTLQSLETPAVEWPFVSIPLADNRFDSPLGGGHWVIIGHPWLSAYSTSVVTKLCFMYHWALSAWLELRSSWLKSNTVAIQIPWKKSESL